MTNQLIKREWTVAEKMTKNISKIPKCFKFAPPCYYNGDVLNRSAKIAQLVERHLAKVEVAGSNPVFRSREADSVRLFLSPCRSGGIGRHVGLKIQWAVMPVRVQVPPSVQMNANQARIVLGFFVFGHHQACLSGGRRQKNQERCCAALGLHFDNCRAGLIEPSKARRDNSRPVYYQL